MTEQGAFEVVVTEIGKLLLPLQQSLDSPENFQSLLRKLGWEADVVPQPLANLGPDLEILFTRLNSIIAGGLSFDGSVSFEEGTAEIDISLSDIEQVIDAVRGVVTGIDAIVSAPNTAFPANLVSDDFKAKFPQQLVSYLVITYLRRHRPGLGFALQALGVTRKGYVAASGNRPSFVEYNLDFSSIPKVLSDPNNLMINAFAWGTDDFDFRALASQIDNLVSSIGLRVSMEELTPEAAGHLEGNVEIQGDPVRQAMRMIFFERARNSGLLSAELSLLPIPRKGAAKPGFALMPAFSGTLDLRMQLGPTIGVTIGSDLDLQGGVGLVFRPDTGVDVIQGFNTSGVPVHAKGSARVEVEYARENKTPVIILGKGNGTRLQVDSVSGEGGIALDANEGVEVFTELEANGLAFVFDPSESDGFISSILGGLATTIEFDLGLGMSYPRGLYFRGTSNLEIQVPAHISLGPIDIQGLTIALNPQADKLPIDLGATFKTQLGPLAAVVENIGLRTDLAFPGKGGNLGPVDLDFGLKPPNGIGLSVDAGVVKGGGYLYINVEKGEYAGALELSFLEFLTLNAIAVINTKMPDGSDGFSMIAIINVEFNPGLQLGFGFTLIGVGGLLGLNRTMDLDALVEGVRTGSLDNVVFPTNVVANAPRIISDMKAFFPPENDIFLVGPMAKFGWGTPTLISMSLGIIIEIPGNIAIVGILKIALPDEKVPLIIINVAFMGAIEFDKKRGWFFANLYDSRIIFMPLEGGLGVLAQFGNDPNFVVSVGGFHPSYNPPALPFTQISRVAINILNTPVAKVRIDAYFAVTSNTVQFGARAELYFGVSIAKVEGHIAFDALFQFSPFYFIIAISASLSVKLFGVGLFSVRFRGSLEGTSPWHVEGTGSISLLFWDVEVDFSHTWGDKKNTSLPPISAMPILIAEFEKAENWIAEPPKSNKLLVSLRDVGEPGVLVLHPVGSLKVTQRAIPLDLTIDKIGAQRPDDANRFSISANTTGIEKKGSLYESFAIAQFQDMGDGEKLNAADFEKEQAGMELSIEGKQTKSSLVTKRIARYEQIIIDNNFKRAVIHFVTLVQGLFGHFLANNAVSKSSLSSKHKKQLHLFDEKIVVKQNAYVVANIADNSPVSEETVAFTSRASATEFIKSEADKNPKKAGQFHVIRSHEMKKVA